MKRAWPVLFLLLIAGCATGYKIENGRWVYVRWDEGRGRTVKTVPGLGPDLKSFKPLRDDYARDDQKVYWENQIIEGADPQTFAPLENQYGKDQSNVFWRLKKINGADPKSFRFIDGRYLYSRDQTAVYFGESIIEDADPESFLVLPGEYQWGKDKRDIYFKNRPLKVKDVGSFKFINPGWAWDRLAYYAVGPVHQQDFGKVDCDFPTMKILDQCYAADRSRVYYGTLPVEGVDLETFRVTGIFTAEDRARKYRFGRVDSRPVAPDSGTTNSAPATWKKFLIGR